VRAFGDAALASEDSAIAMFKAVPDATDRKAAFDAARAEARTARRHLVEARAALRAAILTGDPVPERDAARLA